MLSIFNVNPGAFYRFCEIINKWYIGFASERNLNQQKQEPENISNDE
jgi:hypothetical protein